MPRERSKFDPNDYIAVAQALCEWTVEEYGIDKSLNIQQTRFAAAYEIAKRCGISIKAADESYSFFQCDLPSSRLKPDGIKITRKKNHDSVSNKFAHAISAATPEKPAVLLLNFKIDASVTPGVTPYSPGAKHWVPVIITKNKDGAVTLTTINSSTSPAFNTFELADWLDKAVNKARGSGLVASAVHASRSVQTGNVCGLASANAIGIAVSALKSGRPSIDRELFADEITGDNLEEHYLDQGKRIFGALKFLAKYKDDRESEIDIVERRMLAESGRAGDSPPSSSSAAAETSYNIVLSEETLNRINEYKLFLSSSAMEAGKFLDDVLRAKKYTPEKIGAITTEEFIELLLATKRPQIFAENEIVGNGSDWNLTELGILGDINVTAPVTIFDDGVWGKGSVPKVHSPPLEGELLFTPGALLHARKFRGEIPDLVEVTKIEDGKRVINQETYNALVERRLLPLLAHANSRSTPDKPALVVLPGIGCGAFAGRFKGSMGEHLNTALTALLKKHGSKFPNIAAVHFDPFNECHEKQETIHGIKYSVAPSRGAIPQLSNPGAFGVDPSKCSFFKIVAWDHVSLPGNDFFINIRDTDDGAVGAATNIMQVITGVKGEYTPKGYRPPLNAQSVPYESWEVVANEKQVHLETKGRVRVLKENGQYVKLQGDLLLAPSPVVAKTKPHTEVPEAAHTETPTLSARTPERRNLRGELELAVDPKVPPESEEVRLAKEMVTLNANIRNAAKNASDLNISAKTYHINFMLTDEQTRFALAYEVARHLGISIKQAWMSYNLAVCPLATMGDMVDIDNIVKEAIKDTVVGKPTIILVNYKLDNSELPGVTEFVPGIPHWAPVLLSKNADKKLLVTRINSDTSRTFITNEFSGFVSNIARTAKAAGLAVSETEASRDVQIGLVCGLSSANAGGIAMSLLSKGEVINSEALEREEVGKLNSPDPSVENRAVIYYNAQGRRALAVLEYLAAHPEDIELGINLVEERALVECGILTDEQVSGRARFLNLTIDDMLVQRESLRFGITRLIKDSAIDSINNLEAINGFVEELTKKYTTPSGFNVEAGIREMQETLDAIYTAQGHEAEPEQYKHTIRKSPEKDGMKTPEKRSRDGISATGSSSKKSRSEDMSERTSSKRARSDESYKTPEPKRSHPDAADRSSKRARNEEVGDGGLSHKEKVEWGLSDDDSEPEVERSQEMGGGFPNLFQTPVRSMVLKPDKAPGAPKKRRKESTPSKAALEKVRVAEQATVLEELHRQQDTYTQEIKNLRFIDRIISSDDPTLITNHISEGGDINFADSSGKTPLMYAVIINKTVYYKQLLELHVELESRDSSGKTALGLAIEKGNLPAVIALLLNGANLKNVTYTPLPQLTMVQSVLSKAFNWLSPTRDKVETSKITPEVDVLLRAYNEDPVKWFIDHNATRGQIEAFISRNRLLMTPAMKELAICDLAIKGDFNLVADILRISPDVSFLRSPRVIGVLNSAFRTYVHDDKQMGAALFIMEKAQDVCAPEELIGLKETLSTLSIAFKTDEPDKRER